MTNKEAYNKGYKDGQEALAYHLELCEEEAEPCVECISREFIEIVVNYPPADLCTYPEYKGKPYFSIKYRENGKEYVGFGTYKIEILSQWIKEYFISDVQPKPKTSTWNHGTPDVINEYIITVRERWGKDEKWEYETLGAYYSQDGWEPSYDIDEGQEWEIIAWMPLPEPYKAESEINNG